MVCAGVEIALAPLLAVGRGGTSFSCVRPSVFFLVDFERLRMLPLTLLNVPCVLREGATNDAAEGATTSLGAGDVPLVELKSLL